MASLTVYPAEITDTVTIPMLVVYTVPDVVDTARRIASSLTRLCPPFIGPEGILLSGDSKSTGEHAVYLIKGE